MEEEAQILVEDSDHPVEDLEDRQQHHREGHQQEEEQGGEVRGLKGDHLERDREEDHQEALLEGHLQVDQEGGVR